MHGKKCEQCGITKELNQFYLGQLLKNGTRHRDKMCKGCRCESLAARNKAGRELQPGRKLNTCADDPWLDAAIQAKTNKEYAAAQAKYLRHKLFSGAMKSDEDKGRAFKTIAEFDRRARHWAVSEQPPA